MAIGILALAIGAICLLTEMEERVNGTFFK